MLQQPLCSLGWASALTTDVLITINNAFLSLRTCLQDLRETVLGRSTVRVRKTPTEAAGRLQTEAAEVSMGTCQI